MRKIHKKVSLLLLWLNVFLILNKLILTIINTIHNVCKTNFQFRLQAKKDQFNITTIVLCYISISMSTHKQRFAISYLFKI